MMTILKKLPDVIGFYLPGDRRDDFDGRLAHPVTGELLPPQPSMTKQSFLEECDINNIVRDFTAHGMVTHINEKAAQGAFVDLPDSLDYQQALEIARAGQQAFDVLPAHVRKRFDNDPEKFLEFMGNPDNQEEMIKLGLATRIVTEGPPAPPPNPAPEPPAPPVPPKA